MNTINNREGPKFFLLPKYIETTNSVENLEFEIMAKVVILSFFLGSLVILSGF